MRREPITQQQLEAGGVRCPKCGSANFGKKPDQSATTSGWHGQRRYYSSGEPPQLFIHGASCGDCQHVTIIASAEPLDD